MKITYSKAMIELVYEIRRRIESELKPDIKFANPNLLSDLLIYYRSCEDAILNALIKELMVHAGSEWETRLTSEQSTSANKEHIVRAYRGSVSIEERDISPTPAKPIPRPELIYRGQVVRKA